MGATLRETSQQVLEQTQRRLILSHLPLVVGPPIETVTPPCHDVFMTQLFDAATYEDRNEIGDADDLPERHLRSMPTGDELANRTTQWRLDTKTIETGRKGILAARQALQDAARDTSNTKRRRTAA